MTIDDREYSRDRARALFSLDEEHKERRLSSTRARLERALGKKNEQVDTNDFDFDLDLDLHLIPSLFTHLLIWLCIIVVVYFAFDIFQIDFKRDPPMTTTLLLVAIFALAILAIAVTSAQRRTAEKLTTMHDHVTELSLISIAATLAAPHLSPDPAHVDENLLILRHWTRFTKESLNRTT